MDKPLSLKEYIRWAKKNIPADFNADNSRNVFNLNLREAQNTIVKHDFVNMLNARLSQWDNNYYNRTKSHLFMNVSEFKPEIKPYMSAVDKSFRVNVIRNENYPDPPDGGWITPNNLFESFNDGVRGTLVCKYIDGPRYVIRKLTELANQCRLTKRWYPQQKDEGYYAYHFYTNYHITGLIGIDGGARTADIEMEIQVTTQLQEALRGVTHGFYEKDRLQLKPKNSNWKWEYTTGHFRASYLSHTLHLLEAYIVQARDDYRNRKKESKTGERE
jgi:hypothetical protein